MAEADLQYASVVFKSNKRDQQKEKREDVIYSDVKRPEQTTQPTADSIPGISPDKHSESSHRTYQQLACALGILCVILVLAVITISVYVATLFQRHQTFLLSDIANLKSNINNLTEAFNLLESRFSNLTSENQNLTTNNLELMRLIQDLEKEKATLTEELIRTQSSEVNVSRAQWSIKAYCPEGTYTGRRCKKCQSGWETHGSSCYAIVDNKQTAEWRSWNEAQDDCKSKGSDLVVIDDEEEKNFVRRKSWDSSREKGYWIGLRADAGKWKWIDGSESLPDSWTESPDDGQCVFSYSDGWTSVSCNETNRWTCEKNALSIE